MRATITLLALSGSIFVRGLRGLRLLPGLIVLLSGMTAAGQSGDFDALASKAATAREAGRLDEAAGYYQQALKLRPDWDEGLWYLGTLNYEADRYSDAIPAFKKLAVRQPTAGAVWNLLGLSEFEAGAHEDARAHLQRGLDLGIQDTPNATKVAKYHLALLLNLSGDFDGATNLLASEFSQGPVPDQIKIALGLALLRVPLLPGQIDPSKDALLHAAGETAALIVQRDFAAGLPSLLQLNRDYPDIPLFHFIYAKALVAAGRESDAVSELMEQVKATPKFAAPREMLGQILQRQGKVEQAIREIAAAKQLPPGDAEQSASQARAYGRSEATAAATPGNQNPSPEQRATFDDLAQRASAAQQSGDHAGAANLYKQALALREQWDDGWVGLGTAYYMGENCGDAVPAFKTAVGINPKRSEAWALMGLCEFQAKDYENALLHLQEAQKLGFAANPTGVKIAKYHIALLLIRKGEFEQATDLLVPETGPSPLSDQINVALGLALLRIPVLPQEIAANKQPLVQSAGAAAAALAESRYDQAFAIFQQMLKDAPDTPYLHYAYGVALASNSQYDLAGKELREEIRLTPSSALPHLRLASIALLLHQPEQALTSAQHAVELAPQAVEGHYSLGRAFLELKKPEDAVKELEIAAKLAPGSPEVHFNLAKAYAKAKQPEAAEREREIFSRLNALAEKQRSTTGSQTYAGSHGRSGIRAQQETESSSPE